MEQPADMQRTIIGLPKVDIETLDKISEESGVSRSETIRRAVRDYLDKQAGSHRNFRASAGLWKDRNIDGLSYQDALRAEWDEREE